MGKIKEALMIQEEINELLKEKFNFQSDSRFNILEFCQERDIMPGEARDLIMKMQRYEAEKLWVNKYENEREI